MTNGVGSLQPMPRSWRVAVSLAVLALAGTAYLAQSLIGPRGQATLGTFCLLGIVAACSTNLRAVNWRTLGWGFALQIGLGLFIIKFEIFGVRPGYELFHGIVAVVKQFLAFTNAGAQFVFGKLADPSAMESAFGKGNGFVFAFSALPTIVFVASFFAGLYYFGILPRIVRAMARAMMYLMGTSGAETLSVSANVFVGQTEAPLIIKPYVERMTPSEMLTMMVGGMAHISGGLMAVYIGMGADAVGVLATSVMAAPCSLYLSKLLLPELGQPATRGEVKTVLERPHVNAIDAVSAGAADGMRLAINVAAMLIAFLALLAMFDYLLGLVPKMRDGLVAHVLPPGSWISPALGAIPNDLSLRFVFSRLFSPLAFLIGVQPSEVPAIADLLGTKLVANEFVAYVKLKMEYMDVLSDRGRILATYALTGFANFGSIAIQIGGIGAMAPSRRPDLARLGGRALFVGFLVTLINAAIAGMLL